MSDQNPTSQPVSPSPQSAPLGLPVQAASLGQPVTASFVPAGSLTPNGMVRVKIEDINMPFWAMVGLLIKISLASIPAFIILFAVFFVLTFCASIVGLAGVMSGAR